jgi:hypothetical protein
MKILTKEQVEKIDFYSQIGQNYFDYVKEEYSCGECNWVQEKKMAQKISALLEIPFVTFDFEKQ